ncbi:MAG: glycoside hydrolase family 15 protein [Chloroflexi bacterium]|nr:glycoside hydrolase family 15 protein [Chloroflexota bacterium]
MAYQPIENYGVIGNMRTVALVGMNGSIDWYCSPNFDSPSVFCGLLDEKLGGYFKIAPNTNGVTHKQLYWPETNVLVTRFLSPDGVAETIDFIPLGLRSQEDTPYQLIRRVNCVRGTMRFRMECFPAFNYARDTHETYLNEDGAAFRSPDALLQLWTKTPLEKKDSGVTAEFTLHEGQTMTFALGGFETAVHEGKALSEDEAAELFKATVEYWRRWISQSTYQGRWREMVERSALVLKLLTYEPTGAIVAAPTCSLPEDIGGTRNWDYRYTWIRDAAFTVYALMRIGFTDAAASFMGWIEARTKELNPDGSLQIMYGIDGRHKLTEETLDHLEGYRGSKPVRIGNGAYGQLQLDIYGELMDAVYLFNKWGLPISHDFWTNLRQLTNWVCDNWKKTDEGIWEVRGGQQHFVYSKVMSWVAVDRAIRLADKRSFPADRARWHAVRDEMYEEIMDKGWNPKRKAFVQSYGSEFLDASNLIMPLVFFVSPTDPRMLSTLDAINKTPENGGLVSNSLVYRYDVSRSPDGLIGEEGTFNICTFWLVEAMTRAGRFDRARLDQARLMFEKMLGYANHLGLYAEQIGQSGEALGNFPQAFTHFALISAAFNLDRALKTRR